MSSEKPSRIGRASSLPPSLEARVLHAEDNLVVGVCGPVHLTYYRGPLTVPMLDVADVFHRRLIKAYGRSVVYGLLEPGVAIPPADVRTRSADLIKQNGAHVVAAALVMPGDGFWVSAARSVVTAAFILARHPYPSRCFGSDEEAAVYAVDALGDRSVTVDEIVRIAQAMRDAR